MEPATINYKYYLRPPGRGIKLHLGCGDYWLDGYINIDINVYGGTDMLFDIRQGLPFQPEVVEIIEAYEVLEHFNRDEAFNLLEDWKRVLIPEGKVKISVPDFDGLVEKYPTDEQSSDAEHRKEEVIKMVYGFTDHPNHKEGYTQEKLKALFEQHGYRNVVVTKGSMPERPNEPQLFLEAIK